MAPSILENINHTTRAQLDAYNNFSIDQIFALRSEDCIYEFLPKSLGFPAMDNAAYREYWNTTMVPTFQNFKGSAERLVKFNADEFIYDEQNRKAAVHGITTADSPVGPFVNECSIFLDFDESGKKITRMREMVDSAAVANALAKLHELQAGNAKAAE